MFTVKLVEVSGSEQIHAVDHVWYEPHTGQVPTLYAKKPGVEHPLQFSCGTVYVMNSGGKTVGKYNFDCPPYNIRQDIA